MPEAFSLHQRTVADRDLVDADDELVALAQLNTHAFAELYRRYLDPVHQYCYRRLGTREAAEDATSQIFIQALAGLPKYVPNRGSFRSWLFTIAHNVVIDHYRKTRPDGWDIEAFEMVDRGPTPDELAITAESTRSLNSAIAELPERQRQVVALRLAGLQSREIADVLGCNSRAVDVTQFRAVTRLRVLMTAATQAKQETDV